MDNPYKRPHHHHIKNVPFMIGEYNIYMMDKDGRILIWFTLKNDTEKAKMIDEALSQGLGIRINSWTFETEEYPGQFGEMPEGGVSEGEGEK